MELDFGVLTDDQLVELIRAACAEAVARSEACGFAARSAMLSEGERVRIRQASRTVEVQRAKEKEARELAEREAARVRAEIEEQKRREQAEQTQSLWEKKDTVIQRAQELLADVLDTTESLQVWNKTDKRIYINCIGRRLSNHVEYFHTGTTRERPGTLRLSEKLEPKRNEIKQFCEEIASKWNHLRVNL